MEKLSSMGIGGGMVTGRLCNPFPSNFLDIHVGTYWEVEPSERPLFCGPTVFRLILVILHKETNFLSSKNM